MLYHVSSVSGLTVLMPRVSSHGKAYVYAIDNLVTGLLFGAKHDDFDFLIDADANGTPEIYECYPDAFSTIYQGKSCSVYELREDGFVRGVTSWNPELVCESEVPVEKEIKVTDLYNRLRKEASAGKLILHRYADTQEYRQTITEHIVDRLIRFDAMDLIDKDPRFQKYYRSIIESLRSVMDGHLPIRGNEKPRHMAYPTYTIVPYDEKYRDDMIFMVLEAKNALGRVPRLNEDLLDIPKNYLHNGDMFWLAIDQKNRVIGCIGYHSMPGTSEVWLHRLYVKASRKHQGIGTRLLNTAERYLKEQGKTAAHVHLGGKEYFESRNFYPKHGFKVYAPDDMKKDL